MTEENEKQPGRSPTTSLNSTAKVRLFFNPAKKINDMKKNRISDLFGVIAVFCVFAGCVEGLDGGLTLWTVICLAVAFVSGWISKKTEVAE